MGYQGIAVEKRPGLEIVTLNRPGKLNAIDERTTIDLVEVLAEAKSDGEVRVLVITGSGRSFCSGADIGDLVNCSSLEETTINARREFLRQGFQRIPLALQNLDKPVIAAVNGLAGGLGFDLAMACDIRIASDQAQFAELFVRIGLFPGTGGTWFLPRLVGPGRACELIWTGKTVDAEEAERIGLVNRVVPQGELMAEVVRLAEELGKGPPLALGLSKVAIYQGLGQNLPQALEYAATAEAITLSSEDHREGLSAFREKRIPAYRGR